MRICKCGHAVADHGGWSGQFECRPWLERESDGIIYCGTCDCKAGDYAEGNVPARGARL